MRLLSVIPILLFALAAFIFGGVMFVKIGADMRHNGDEMQSIRTGQVPAETLTVVRKYGYPQKSGTPRCYVVFHNKANEEIKKYTSRPFFDAAKIGDHVTGYRFPDGYIIPKALNPPMPNVWILRWLFLCIPSGMGLIFLLIALRSMTRAANADSPSIADAIRARMNQSSEL